MLGWAAAAWAVPDVDTPMRTGARAPEDAAVVIGIEDYAFLSDVPAALRDGRSLYNFFVYARGVPAEQVTLLAGGNREQILAAVQRAAAQVGPGGTLWVTYAGHGATNPDDGGPLLVGDDAKSDPSVFVARSVKLSELPAEAVLVLDTCWAGRGRDGAELVPGTRFAVPSYALTRAEGALLTAAQPSQLSEPYEPGEHGLYTYFFAGAVRGWADGELDGTPDGQVTLAEAHAFVGRAIATVHPSGQQPTFSGGDRVLVSAPGKLEAAPDLRSFPKVGQLALPEPSWNQEAYVPYVPYVPEPPRSSWTGTLSYAGDGVLRSSDGQNVSFADAVSARFSDPSVTDAWTRYNRDVTMQKSGLSFVGTGAVLGALAYFLVGGVDGFQENDSSIKYLYPGLSAGVMGLGATSFALGTAKRKTHREKIVDALNGQP